MGGIKGSVTGELSTRAPPVTRSAHRFPLNGRRPGGCSDLLVQGHDVAVRVPRPPDRRPHGWVVGGSMISTPWAARRSWRASTSVTRNSTAKLPLAAVAVEPGTIDCMPRVPKEGQDGAGNGHLGEGRLALHLRVE